MSSFALQNAKTFDFLVAAGRVQADEAGENTWLTAADGKKCLVLKTPHCHHLANIMGLSLLMRLGFTLTETGASFSSAFLCL